MTHKVSILTVTLVCLAGHACGNSSEVGRSIVVDGNRDAAADVLLHPSDAALDSNVEPPGPDAGPPDGAPLTDSARESAAPDSAPTDGDGADAAPADGDGTDAAPTDGDGPDVLSDSALDAPGGDSMTDAAPHCGDGVRDALETDVDCGGPDYGFCRPVPETCERCGLGQTCTTATDCKSFYCLDGACAAPSCADGVLNGTEGDVDCGGDCAPCGLLSSCRADTDCQSGACMLPEDACQCGCPYPVGECSAQ